MTDRPRPLDVVCIGRSSVDLYGEQVGGRLEEMASFAKYVGGCPTNIAVGSARLGLKSGLITRVGDEHMGRFLREQLEREGVDTRFVITDPARLTALVILGIRDKHSFPLIFYRENCADAALSEEDIEEDYIAATRAVVVTGTHFSRANLDAASRKAMALARRHGARVIFDIDYRPVLWGLTGHGAGEERFVADDRVTAHLQSIVPGCDVVVGTEEEIHIAGGTTDTLAAVRRLRELAPGALILVKRGPMGCTAFPGEIPDDLEKGVHGPGFPVEVYNVLGAGDAFMSGFLRGYLRDLPLAESLRLANACGAFAVSRHGCAPAVPSWTELDWFLRHGSGERELRKDRRLEHIHWATTRDRRWPQLLAFAADHRRQFEELATRSGRDLEAIGRFKDLALEAAARAAAGRADAGILLDDRYAGDALARAADLGCWIGRPIEEPGAVPLRFDDARDLGTRLREWPRTHCVKCLVFYHPDDPEALRERQEDRLLALFEAARGTGHELLLEVIPDRTGNRVATDTLARVLDRFYDLGIMPDWWKLPDPGSDAAWEAVTAVVERRDPWCRGVLLLGLDAPEAVLAESFARAAGHPLCKGFAVGRTIFGGAAERWFRGEIDDAGAIAEMADRYRRLIALWERARGSAGAARVPGGG